MSATSNCRRFLVFDNQAAQTTDGHWVDVPAGSALVNRSADGFVITTTGQPPVTITAGEFDRLLMEGQLRSLCTRCETGARPRQPDQRNCLILADEECLLVTDSRQMTFAAED
jgi:hypothetical protein